MPGAAVLGSGCALPEREVSNAELMARLDTSDAWIVSRTGIRARRTLDGSGLATSDLAVAAARTALARAEVCAEESLAAAEDDGASTVTEEDGGVAISPVDVTRERVGPYQQHVPRASGRQRMIRQGEPVDEARAGRVQVEGRRVPSPERRLDEAGCRRDRVVPRAGRHDDEVEARRVHLGARERHPRRRDRQVRGCEPRAIERAAGPDARPRDDPCIRGVEPSRELGVGHLVLGQREAAAEHGRARHRR